MTDFPSLDGFGPSRNTLHKYAQAVGAIARVHATHHPKWWHVSLIVTPDGLLSNTISLPDGGTMDMLLNLRTHMLEMRVGSDTVGSFDMTQGWNGTQMGDALIAAAADLGLHANYDRERFESDDTGEYDEAVVGRFFTALTTADRAFRKHQASLPGEAGPVQLWPHGFDLATEWYGTRVETYTENGQTQSYPSQLNLGLYLGAGNDDTYFYSNPWPFDESLVNNPLPSGAVWHIEGWQGTMLPYSELVETTEAEERLLDYAQAVFEVASPTLMAAE